MNSVVKVGSFIFIYTKKKLYRKDSLRQVWQRIH